MALHNRRDGNREAIQAFANQFDPPLNIAATRAVGGVAVTNGWQASLHDPEIELGITAVVWGGGHFKVWMELQATASDGGELGSFFAAIVREAKGMADEEEQREPEPLPEINRAPSEFWNRTLTDDVKDLDLRRQERLEKLPEFPNPQLINMMELRVQERLDLVAKFPELAFVTKQGQRFRTIDNDLIPDDRAGFCTEEQLKAVRATLGMRGVDRTQDQAETHIRRSIPRMPQPGIAADVPLIEMPELKPMGAPPKPNCDHNWVRNSVGDGETCSKCHGFQRVKDTRVRQAAVNIERRERRAAEDLEMRLKRMADAKEACEGDGGRHMPVTIEQDGRPLTVCQLCGTEVPPEKTAVLGDPGVPGEGGRLAE